MPAASRATAVNVCEPLLDVVVSHVTAYGADVSVVPGAAPSIMNCTLATPTLSFAAAATVTLPLTDDPDAGAVIVTLGGVVSGGGAFETVTVTGLDTNSMPSRSRATAVSVCDPSADVVVPHATLYGALLSAAPRFTPSSRN